MPIFETFGHQERLLSLPAFSVYAELREQPASVKALSGFFWSWLPAVAGALKIPDPEAFQQPASCLSPVSADGRARITELIHELARSIPSPFFHLGGDEPVDLGKGASREAVKRCGVGRVYAAYETALARDVQTALHRQPVLFADFLLKEPVALDLVPRDVAVMDWDYDPATVGAVCAGLPMLAFERSSRPPDYGTGLESVPITLGPSPISRIQWLPPSQQGPQGS
jgi:hypothetical protein